MISRYVRAGVVALACIASTGTTMAIAADAPEGAKTAISDEAAAAVQQMGKSLASTDMSFKARTIRVYEDDNGQPLHIFHSMSVVVHRPDRLAVRVDGDDGSQQLTYDGKSVAVASLDKNKYSQIEAPNTIQATLELLMERLGVDFPLADFLTPQPNKAFLTGVVTGTEVNTVTIDGHPYRHLLFTQPPSMELELWVDNTAKALPRRLIVTYRLLPGQPNFIAEFSDWQFGTRHPESEFAFEPSPGAMKVDLKAANTGSSGSGDE